MTIGELLDYLDGNGLVITDEFLIECALSELDLSVEDLIQEKEI